MLEQYLRLIAISLITLVSSYLLISAIQVPDNKAGMVFVVLPGYQFAAMTIFMLPILILRRRSRRNP